jgi:GDP-D-mannose dehydratase
MKIQKKIAVISGIKIQNVSLMAEFLLKKNYFVHKIQRRTSTFNSIGKLDKNFQDNFIKNKKIFVKLINYYFRPNDVENLRGNFNKAKNFLKWKPITNFKKLIKLIVKNYLENFKNNL